MAEAAGGQPALLADRLGFTWPTGQRALQLALEVHNPEPPLLLPRCCSDLELSLPSHLPSSDRLERVTHAIQQVGLGGFRLRPIQSLSGGQKQRLAIAGALASDAQLLLLDEPTALLDETSQQEVINLIHQLCHRAEQPITALWITHRLEELNWCDGAALMERGSIGPWQAGTTLQTQLRPLATRKG